MISQFLGKKSINLIQDYLEVLHNLYCSHNGFQNFSKSFQNFIRFPRNFPKLVVSQTIISHFRLIFQQKVHTFSIISQKYVSKFIRKFHQISIRIFFKCMRRVPKIFSIIFLSCYFLNFSKIVDMMQ